ncbi:MAG: hypothetical protein ACJ8FY_06570 [Gemmataceae bacterium]
MESRPFKARLVTPFSLWISFLWLSAHWGLAESPAVGRLLPVSTREGHCECVLPTARFDEKFFVIVGSLNQDLTNRRVTLRTSATSAPLSIPLENDSKPPEWIKRMEDMKSRLEKARQNHPLPHEYQAVADPPHRKTFHLLAKEGDLQDPGNYQEITADLIAVGRHCLAYVEHDIGDQKGIKATAQDAVATFDGEIYPQARARLGQALDVDRDGRFAILFTNRLGKLSGGKAKLDGFVRGSDFYRDLDPPLGNQCDMMYLAADLKPGAYLRTLLAHEYTHAVVFSEHVFGNYQPDQPGNDEEAWLNEAIAHVNEDIHGYSWENLDYRISAYLAEPARYSVVVPDYFGSKLWRSHGHRGATYLFLRWCVERSGPDLLHRLVQTNLSGVTNLEVATGERFGDLFRQWAASMLISGSKLSLEGVPSQRPDLHQPLAGRLLTGPRFEGLQMDKEERTIALAGTSVAFFLLHSPKGERTRLAVDAEDGMNLQVSLIRLPASTGRLDLKWDRSKEPRLLLTARDSAMNIDAMAWERVPPLINSSADTSFRADSSMEKTVRAWLGDPHLEADQTRRSGILSLPKLGTGQEKVIVKIAATDALGHHISAWIDR